MLVNFGFTTASAIKSLWDLIGRPFGQILPMLSHEQNLGKKDLVVYDKDGKVIKIYPYGSEEQ